MIQGGFAKCYEMTDTATGILYAGKIVPKSLLVKAHQKEKVRFCESSKAGEGPSA